MPEAEVVNPVANGNEATASPMLKINIVEQIEVHGTYFISNITVH